MLKRLFSRRKKPKYEIINLYVYDTEDEKNPYISCVNVKLNKKINWGNKKTEKKVDKMIKEIFGEDVHAKWSDESKQGNAIGNFELFGNLEKVYDERNLKYITQNADEFWKVIYGDILEDDSDSE